LTSTTLTEWINKIGGVNHEELSGSFFSGFKTGSSVTSDSDGICTGKSFTSLSAFRGSCSDAPRLNGGYSIAGLSYFARQTDLNSDILGSQHVRTLGVALAPAVPSIKIPVPGTADAFGKNPKYIQVLPACKSNRKQEKIYGKDYSNETMYPGFTGITEGNCAIVDFKIVETDIAVVGKATNKAKLYVNWEVAEQGNDYDQDMWGTIDISVNNTDVGVTTRLMAVSASASMGFGYVISGTESDGFKVSSGHRNFSEPNTYCATNQCKCNASDAFGPCELTKLVAGVTVPGMAATPEQKYKVNKDATKETAKFLPTALELAAKWGGYSSNFEKEAKNAAAMLKKTYDSEFIAKRIKVRDYKKDSYFYAADPRALAKSLRNAFNEIAAGIGAASSVATVSARVSDGSLVYQAQFNSEDWTGDLLAYEFTKVGNINPAPKYCTSDIIVSGEKCTGKMAKSATSRTIYTRGATLTGLASLAWGNLSLDQQKGLRLLSETNDDNAKKRLDWLSGNATYEEASGGTLRNRGLDANRNILGDIVNSSPVYVGGKNFRYENLPDPAGPDYKTFLGEKKGKPDFIIVGANDGMVHAFNASTMAESFAFIPSQVFARDDELLDEGTKLTNLSSPTYGVTTSNGHAYSVDGPITYSDVYITVDGVKKWRRIVVGTLGAGGRGIYALDVTDATPTLLFELNKANYSELGYVIGKPIIAPMKNGSWAVIFGNGSHSETASSLFVIDIENPNSATHSKVISTGEGTGLSAPALLLNSVGQATIAYAGDVNGNMWRFDLSSADPTKWKKDYKVFKAITTATPAESQPITGAPTLGVNAKKDFKTMVYFGTGKYFDVLDNSAVIPVQSFYAVLDTGAEVSRSSLLSKVVTTTAGTTNPTREVTVANPDWGTQNGWYLDFDVAGERVTTKPLLLFDKLIFPTLIPTTLQCNAGGESWLMEVSAVGDKYINDPILSENLYATSLVLGNLNFVSVEGGGGAIVKNQSDGVVTSVAAPPPQPIEGRESWRQLQ
jgi:type IV pilus assembly protein PilY1